MRDWANRRRDDPDTEEAKLARAKLIVMMKNLGERPIESFSARGHPQGCVGFLRDEAYGWVFGDSDFDWWCEAAGFDPRQVRRKAQSIYDNGLPDMKHQRARAAIRRPYKGRRKQNPTLISRALAVTLPAISPSVRAAAAL